MTRMNVLSSEQAYGTLVTAEVAFGGAYMLGSPPFPDSKGKPFFPFEKRYGPLVGAKVGCGPSGALQVVARE